MTACPMCHTAHGEDGPCAPVTTDPATPTAARPFPARFPGYCRVCRVAFDVDDLIAYDPSDRLIHAGCAS